MPETNPSFAKINKGKDKDSSYILSVDKSKAVPGSYFVRIATEVTYPDGSVLDHIIKLPIVIFNQN